MKVILKYCVKITEESMLWCVIASITEVYTSQKGRNFSVISIRLRIYKNTFLMVCKQGSNNLHRFLCKVNFNEQHGPEETVKAVDDKQPSLNHLYLNNT